eukprot:jgi/Orpsp1_1/1185453/evm.model.c7180000093846.1
MLPREPLTLPLNTRVLKNMKGFGFGTPEEIGNIIEQTISLNITKDTENFKFLNIIRKRNRKSNGINNRSGSIKSITRSISNASSTSNSFLTDDESQITKHVLPIVNIYYLVAEKLERLEKYKISMEMQNQTAALHHANQLNNYKNHDIKLSEAIIRDGIVQNSDSNMTAVSTTNETDTPTIPANIDSNNTNTTVVTVNTTSLDDNNHRPSPVPAIKVETGPSPSRIVDIDRRNEDIKFEISPNSSSEDSINHYTEHIAQTLESKEDEYIKMDSEVILDSTIMGSLDDYSTSGKKPSNNIQRNGVKEEYTTYNSNQTHRHRHSHNNSNSETAIGNSISIVESNEVRLQPPSSQNQKQISKENLHNSSQQNSPLASRRSFSSPSPIKSISSNKSNKRKSNSNYSPVAKSIKSDPNSNTTTIVNGNTNEDEEINGANIS